MQNWSRAPTCNVRSTRDVWRDDTRHSHILQITLDLTWRKAPVPYMTDTYRSPPHEASAPQHTKSDIPSIPRRPATRLGTPFRHAPFAHRGATSGGTSSSWVPPLTTMAYIHACTHTRRTAQCCSLVYRMDTLHTREGHLVHTLSAPNLRVLIFCFLIVQQKFYF